MVYDVKHFTKIKKPNSNCGAIPVCAFIPRMQHGARIWNRSEFAFLSIIANTSGFKCSTNSSGIFDRIGVEDIGRK